MMRRFAFVPLAVSCLLSTVSGKAGMLAPCGGGGPDSFGYRYLDSDTVCPGAPTFRWVEVKGVGTEITTLGDDNTAGPFDIGFDFPYYWYRVNSVVVGSNGYITFGDTRANASPFHGVPSPDAPNNQLALMLCDLDCSYSGSPHGSVWYWSSAGADTFIVEYDSIEFWSTGGNNTFEVILSRPDSTITFQYKEQSGEPDGGWVSNQTGIEDISGTIGLNYLSGMYPPQNIYHDSLAVLFIPPESTTLRIHDVGVRNAMNDRNGGLFVLNNQPLIPWAVVGNYGNQPEAAFKTRFRVTRQDNTVVFSDSMLASALNPGQTDSLVLPSTWQPSEEGTYILRVITRLTGDMTPMNDTATIELRVVTLPANLSYDGGTARNYVVRPGLGNRFVPPVYPCSVISCRINAKATSTTDCPLGIFDDDGPGGGPGTVLFMDTVFVTAAGWYTVTPPAPVVIADGAFFVCGTTESTIQLSFGADSTKPLSFQGWEYTGVWAPSRDMAVRDVCANATVSGPVSILEATPGAERQPTNVGATIVRGVLDLSEAKGDRRMAKGVLLDAVGRKVLDLHAGANDVRSLAPGIYFVLERSAVSGERSAVTKVVIQR
jgi:hypothetical protein